MLISHAKRFIYTKTVKTAGTSVESYFEPYCMRPGEWHFSHARKEYVSEAGVIGIRTGQPLELQSAIWWNHMPARTIRSLIGAETWNGYFKFCVVRNPYDQLVSAYHFFPDSRPSQEQRPTLLGRLKALVSPRKQRVDLKADFESWLQSIPLPLDRNKYTIDDELCVDFVIQQERLGEGLRDVCRTLDLEFVPERIPHLKRSEREKRPLRDYYSAASIAIVEQSYRFELDRFGYQRPW